MEKITPGDEYLHLESDIMPKNADALRQLIDDSSFTLAEHIRRAAALYQLSIEMYEKGGDIYSVSQNGPEVIPLFDINVGDTDERVKLSVKNINSEVAKLFEKLGIDDANTNTTVLDNVINYYYEATVRAKKGDKIFVESPDGAKNELLFI